MVQIDMDMPKRCFDCLIEEADDYGMRYECSLVYKGYTDKIRMDGRLAECPLREVQPKDEVTKAFSDGFEAGYKRGYERGIEDGR